jgi:invasion protein IalB
VFTTPVDVLIQPGLVLKVDAQDQQQYQFTSCQPGGCRGVVTLSDEQLASLRAGSVLGVGWITAAGNQMVVPINLLGFSAAWRSLTE